MCEHENQTLTFETMLSDPLIRMVMRSDGVGMAEMVAVLEAAREAVMARELRAVRRVTGGGGTARVGPCQCHRNHR